MAESDRIKEEVVDNLGQLVAENANLSKLIVENARLVEEISLLKEELEETQAAAKRWEAAYSNATWQIDNMRY